MPTPKEVAQQKWDRMQNPKCAADYGLGLNEAEMRMIPQGRAILADMKRTVRAGKNMRRMTTALGAAFGRRLEQDLKEVLCPERK